MFDNVEILIDLQTGAISVVIPGTATENGDPIEIECVTADDAFAPRE